MKKIISVTEAGKLIPDNASIMIGGFLSCGTPSRVVESIVENKTKELTLIANDTSTPENDRGKLIVNKQISKAIVAHIGTNPETGRQMNAGELEVELVPMGTLVERIRSGGAGLGGVLTPTGIGTLIAEGKPTMEIDGKTFLYEKPLKADFALIYGTKVDKFGNIFIHGTARNFNQVMATAAQTVIVEAEELVDEALNPDEVTIPGIFVDYIAR